MMCRILLLLVVFGTGNSSNNTFQILIVISNSSQFDTSVILPTVDLAISSINASSVLNGFTLCYSTVLDSRCNRELTEQLLTEHLTSSSPQPIAVIGCGCSNATEGVANISLLQNIPVVSYSSPSAILSNTTLYPSLFRTIPSLTQICDALVTFIQLFNWNQVLLITEEISFQSEEFSDFLTLNNIKLKKHSLLEYGVDKRIFSSSNRIFILDAYSTKAWEVLCQAYNEKKHYPSYAWIIINNFINDDWWNLDDESINCTRHQIKSVLNYSIIIMSQPEQYLSDYNNKNSTEFNSKISMYAYDAVWSIAWAINSTINNHKWTNRLTETFRTLSFTGVSGMISWDNNNDREDTVITFNQLLYKDDIPQERTIAVYQEENLTVFNETYSIWPLGIPSDGIPVIVIDPIHPAVFGIAICFTIMGLIWVTVCLIFNIVYRNTKIIRLTSPKLNLLLMFGAISVYISIVFYSVSTTDEETVNIICPIQVPLATILGYDVCVSVSAVKMWRIYYIFKNPRPNKKVPQDSHLLLIVVLLVAIDAIPEIILLTVDAVIYSPTILKQQKDDYFNSTTGETLTYYFWDCRNSPYSTVFSALTITHKIVIHIATVFFAFQTRKIKITVLNEYKYNVAYAYCAAFVTFIVLVAVFIVARNQTLYAFFYSSILFVGCTVFLALTFVPKMIALKRDPKGEKIFDDPQNTQATSKENERSISTKSSTVVRSESVPNESIQE